MDWENHPLAFVFGIVGAAALGALAAGLKEVNGTGIRWRRLVCRSIYRCANGIAAGFIISTITSDLRILWAAVILFCVTGIGEDTILKMLPFNVHHDAKKQPNREDP